MNIFFILLVIIHLLIWIFVLTAFLSKKTAEINLYYIIPLVYVLHMLPFHIINVLKETIEPENTSSKVHIVEINSIIVPIFWQIKDIFTNSFANPLSPQGMLIFGAITFIIILIHLLEYLLNYYNVLFLNKKK